MNPSKLSKVRQRAPSHNACGAVDLPLASDVSGVCELRGCIHGEDSCEPAVV
jgi:hypothetical protein